MTIYVNDAYRKAIVENPDIGIREFANSIGGDFLVVRECLGFADWFDFYDTDDGWGLEGKIYFPILALFSIIDI